NQPATFGSNAFASIGAGLTSLASAGTVVVNVGAYAETPSLTSTSTLRLVGDVTVSSVSGAGGTIDLQSFRLTTGNGTGDDVLAATVLGTGGITKIGSDTLTLSGTDTYTGVTTVSAGSLLVSGSLTSPLSIATGAILGGTGTIS